ncbi:hypothetical protein K449DRAFT_428002 [Hypoxylon sp. EC38]|nr:hypothetical protein K449DRAFT_428002 [Hypoxylon sp. EC38]
MSSPYGLRSPDMVKTSSSSPQSPTSYRVTAMNELSQNKPRPKQPPPPNPYTAIGTGANAQLRRTLPAILFYLLAVDKHQLSGGVTLFVLWFRHVPGV